LDKYQNPDTVESVTVFGFGLPEKTLEAQIDCPIAEGISVHSARVPFRAELPVRIEFGVLWSQNLHVLTSGLYAALRLSHTNV
jgi:hypothetical protein